MAHAHADWIKAVPEAKVVGLCDTNPQQLDSFWKNKLGGDKTIRRYDSLQKILDHPSVGLNGFILVTPRNLHFEQSMACLEASYHVLVEKPMVTSSVHARKLAQQVRKTGKLLLISFQAC